MPNLENIHYKFFPKSKTAPWGKKLLYFAWVIEILVASVSFSIAMIFFFTKGESSAKFLEVVGLDAVTADGVIVSLAFLVVTLMELTKIPLAIALYYAQQWKFKILFLFLLLAANISTFETIIQGFELGYNQRLQSVNKERKKLEDIQSLINLKKNSINPANIDAQIEKSQKILSEQQKNKSQIIINRSKELTQLKTEYNSDNDVVLSIKQRLDATNNNRDKALKTREQLTLSSKNFSVFNNGPIARQIKTLDGEIQRFDKTISDLEKQLFEAQKKTAGRDQPKINIINQKYDNLLIPVNSQIENLSKEINSLAKQKNELATKSDQIRKEIGELNDEYEQQRKIYKDKESSNQIYRIALLIKRFDSWIKDIEIIPLINEKDVYFAFIVWFGTLAFVISIIGTGVAFAGLHLMDERMHYERNKPGKGKVSKFVRNLFSIPLFINKYIWNATKSFWKPKVVEKPIEVEKIVEKIVEKPVEVIKVVDKIIEKPVVEEKIVYQKIEVPKEVIKKVYVHVPFPTDDPGILKKGPIVHNDDDEKDKK